MIKFDDQKLWLVQYLAERLDVPVSTRSTPAVPRVVVRRDGGVRVERPTMTARFGIRFWERSEGALEALGLSIHSHLYEAVNDGPCRRVSFLSAPIEINEAALDVYQGYLSAEFVMRSKEN